MKHYICHLLYVGDRKYDGRYLVIESDEVQIGDIITTNYKEYHSFVQVMSELKQPDRHARHQVVANITNMSPLYQEMARQVRERDQDNNED